MDKSKSASSGFFKILEKVIRSHPLLYYVARYFIRFTNIFEDDAHGVVLLNFKNKINIIDVGASDGIAARFFNKKLKVNKILCFEPNQSYIKILKGLKIKNLIVFPYGISQLNEKHIIYYPRYKFFTKNFDLIPYTFYKKSRLLEQIEIDFKFKKNLSIVKRLINLKKIQKIQYKISLIKIDVNGYEFSTVKGLKKIIEKDRPAMLVETDTTSLDKENEKIANFLKKFNYRKYRFSKNEQSFVEIKKRYPLNTYFLQKNHLKFIKKS